MHLVIVLILLIVLMIVFIYFSGWFSGVETAMTNLTVAQIAEMKKNGEKNVEYISKLKKNMDRTLVAILIGNNLVNILLASVATLIANALFQELGVTIMVAVITFLIIIFGEITPKSNAIVNSKTVAQKKSRVLYYLVRFLGPAITFFILLSQKIILAFGGTIKKDSMLVSDESIKSLATLGEEEGVIKSIERDIIHKVFLFGDRKIEDILVPMKDVFYLDKNYGVEEAKKLIRDKGFTRVPVMGEGRKIIGLVYSKDLLGKHEGKINHFMRTPFVISQTRDVTDVFNEMKQNRIHMAIVENSAGEQIGVVTLEDILEEIVGEIQDEYFEIKFRREEKDDDNDKRVPMGTAT